MTVIRRDPFSELLPLRDAIDRIFEERFMRPSEWFPRWERQELALDIYETADRLVVKAALPGIKPEDVDLTVSRDLLTIKGEFKAEEKVEEKEYRRQELRYGTFERSVSLPEGLKADEARATFEHGMLTIHIPKSERVAPRHIKVLPESQEP
jgi:HSP20 family protein